MWLPLKNMQLAFRNAVFQLFSHLKDTNYQH